MLRPSWNKPCFKALFHDWRRSFPCGLCGIGHSLCPQFRTDVGIHSGLCGSGIFPSAIGRKRQNKGGRGYGTALQRGFGGRRYDDILNFRNEYGCMQLYVRLYPGYQPFGSSAFRRSFRGGFILIYCILSADFCGNL